MRNLYEALLDEFRLVTRRIVVLRVATTAT